MLTHHLTLKGLRDKLLKVMPMPLYGGLLGVHVWCADGWPDQLSLGRRRGDVLDSPERCDFGVKTAALAALGEMAAPRAEGVRAPLVAACRGVKDGESTLKRFLVFSCAATLFWSWT